MREIVRSRGLAVAVLALLFAAALSAKASASVEYCGATVAAAPVGVTAGSASSIYALKFFADNPRTVTGTTMLHTDAGYFTVDFKNVDIAAHTEKYRASTVTFTREKDHSNEVFVQFPKPVTMIASWISSASVTNDPQSGWDGQQHVCPAYDAQTASTPKRSPTLAERIDPTPAPLAVTPDTVFLHPVVAQAPPSPSCAVPFADATVTKPVPPNWPSGYSIRHDMDTLVRVRVSPQGTVDGAAVYMPTGISVFDDAAVEAARASTYTPRRSLCTNVPGDYLFRVHWQPQ